MMAFSSWKSRAKSEGNSIGDDEKVLENEQSEGERLRIMIAKMSAFMLSLVSRTMIC